MDETKELLLAIRHAVEHSNARLESIERNIDALTGQVKKLTEKVENIERQNETIKRENRETNRFLKGLAQDLNETMDRVDRIDPKHGLL